MALFQDNKWYKILLTGILSLPVIQIFSFEDGFAFNFLQAHNHLAKLYAILFGIVTGFIGGGLAAGFKEYKDLRWSETVEGETRYNPAYAWWIGSVLLQAILILLFE